MLLTPGTCVYDDHQTLPKNLGSENFGETVKPSQNGMLTNITKAISGLANNGQRCVGHSADVLHGEQVVNTSTVDKNSFGMRNEYNDAFHRSSYFSQMNHGYFYL